MIYIKYMCNYWFTLFDYDFTGIRLAILYFLTYNITPIIFKYKQLSFDTIKRLIKEFGVQTLRTVIEYSLILNMPSKDFSDNLEILGKEKMQHIINILYKRYDNT